MEHERFESERTLMRTPIGESDRWRGKPLYDAIVELLRAEKLSGATAPRAWAASVLLACIPPKKSCGCRRICRL